MKYFLLWLVVMVFLLSCSRNPHQDKKNITENYTSADSIQVTADSLGSENKIDSISDIEARLIFTTDFYAEYLKAKTNKSTDSVLSRYCTSGFYDSLTSAELSYDLFIDAQDYPDDLFDRLSFAYDSLSKLVVVSYTDDYSGDIVSINLMLTETDSSFRIKGIRL